MRFVPDFTGALGLAHTALTSLNVTLSQTGNTLIKAVVQNDCPNDISFVYYNFYGDSAPVKEVSICRNGKYTQLKRVLE